MLLGGLLGDLVVFLDDSLAFVFLGSAAVLWPDDTNLGVG